MTWDWYFSAFHWLVANGLWRDVLATVIGLGAARALAARPIKNVKASQARQEDLLDTSTPGGLAEVHAELQKLSKLLGDDSNQEPGNEEPEDETPDMDDKDKGPSEPSHRNSWLNLYRRSRKGHGGSGVATPEKAAERSEQLPDVRPHVPYNFPGGHR